MQREMKFEVIVKGRRKQKSKYEYERDKEMLEMLYKNDKVPKSTYTKAKQLGEKNEQNV
jgi:hypothetical protein